MLADPVPWRGKAGRAFVALLLSLFSGVVTAAYAGYALESGWAAYARCNPPPAGLTCPPTTFWGLGNGWFVLLGVLGIVTGLLTAVIGWEVHRRAFGIARGAYALLALSLAGLVAYGGFGVGVATGVAGGLLFASLRPRRTGAPSEWSGVLPVGVPAVKAPSRPVTEKPAVSEWDGVSMPAYPQVASSAGLPSADRLAAALARSRNAGRGASTAPVRPPAVVLLPPPPTGLLHDPAPPPPHAATRSNDPAPPPPHAATRSNDPAPIPPHAAARSHDPASADPAQHAPAIPPASAPVSTRPSHPVAAPPPTLLAALRAKGGHEGAMREFVAPRGDPPANPARPHEAATPGTHTGGRGPERAPAGPTGPHASPAPGPASTTPAPNLPTPAAPAAERAHLEGSGSNPIRPSGSRIRAWSCPKCRLMNAPWSDHCTRCRTPAPGP